MCVCGIVVSVLGLRNRSPGLKPVHLLIGRRVASSLWPKFARAVVCSTRARSWEHVGFREFHAHASCVWFLWRSELGDRSEKR